MAKEVVRIQKESYSSNQYKNFVDREFTTFVDPTPYERVDTVGNVFNRLVLFDGGLIHSGNDYFGWDIPSSRLFQIFFFE